MGSSRMHHDNFLSNLSLELSERSACQSGRILGQPVGKVAAGANAEDCKSAEGLRNRSVNGRTLDPVAQNIGTVLADMPTANTEHTKRANKTGL